MRNTYIRPLKFDYVDANQQHYKIKDIPVKFLQEEDDYQKRKNKTETIVQQRPEFDIEPHLQEAPQPTVNNQSLEPQHPKTTQQKNRNQSVFGCCHSEIQYGEMCSKCFQSLCKNCINHPQKVKQCTKCLQKLCQSCKKNLKIAFPDYKLRNYAINIKNYQKLHFGDCPCKNCKQN